jgi:hypothetical protein
MGALSEFFVQSYECIKNDFFFLFRRKCWRHQKVERFSIGTRNTSFNVAKYRSRVD